VRLDILAAACGGCRTGIFFDCIADTPILADANRYTSTHVFSNIAISSALISHLSRHVSRQAGGYIKVERRVVQDPAVDRRRADRCSAPPRPPTISRPSRPPAPRAMPIEEICRSLDCTECHTEVRGRVFGLWFRFRGARRCAGEEVRGGRGGGGARGCSVQGVRRHGSFCALCLCVV